MINVVPQTGGNTFSGSVFAGRRQRRRCRAATSTTSWSPPGLREPGKLKKLWDVNGAIGGPIVKDQLWFFLTGRYQRTAALRGGHVHTTRTPATRTRSSTTRTTASRRSATACGTARRCGRRGRSRSRQKLNLFWDEQDMCRNCSGGGSATTSPEAQDGSQNINYIHAYQASYTAPSDQQSSSKPASAPSSPATAIRATGFDRSMVRASNRRVRFRT